MSANAVMEKIEDVTVLGHPMIFTCLRVDRDMIPNGIRTPVIYREKER